VIDTHCHLDACEPPVAELVGRARAAGVARMATVGMNGPSIGHALAARVGLPVVIHTRAAEDDTFALLREHADSIPAVIMHCFSAADRLDECVERGYLCSFAGNVTYPKAVDLQQAARDVPAELLLVETDSPYLAPQPVRGKPNEPANVAHTARFVAELRGVEYAELERTVDANAERVFGP
jgi:TatD DNase family protein